MACGMIFTPVVSTVGQYFTKLRAWAMGIVVSGAAIGGIIFPITLNRLLSQVGFGWAVRVVGFLMLALLAYAGVTTKEFAPRRQNQLFLLGAFKKWPYVLANAGFLIGLMGLYGPIFYISSYSLARGMDSQLAQYQVAILNAPSFFGRTIPNFMGDKFGRFNMSIIAYLACAILCFCWTAAESTAGITVWVIFFGFFSGAIFSLYSPTIAQGTLSFLLSSRNIRGTRDTNTLAQSALIRAKLERTLVKVLLCAALEVWQEPQSTVL